LLQICLLSLVEQIHVSLQRKLSMLSTPYLGHCFIVRIVLFLEEILPDNHSFQRGYQLILFQIGLFSQAEKHMYLSNKTTVLEAGTSSTLFPCEN
jgi:hypothetical protein